MNGKEIKNIVKTTSLLAKRKDVPLNMEPVATVLRIKEGSPGIKETSHSRASLLHLFLPF